MVDTLRSTRRIKAEPAVEVDPVTKLVEELLLPNLAKHVAQRVTELSTRA